MNRIYLLRYAVKGIKNLDDWAVLSFYNKTIKKSFSIQKYNVKGIYGTNGSGKSGIVRSVQIMKNLIADPYYLNNTYVQKLLNDVVNKKTKKLSIKADFLHQTDEIMLVYHYEIDIEKNHLNAFEISSEKLCSKKATSASETMNCIYQTEHGVIEFYRSDPSNEIIVDLTKNLLSDSTLPSAFIRNEELIRNETINDEIWNGVASLILLASHLFICMDKSDEHSSYYLRDYSKANENLDISVLKSQAGQMIRLSSWLSSAFQTSPMTIKKDLYRLFEESVKQLYSFIRIFKNDLKGIEIDRKENEDSYVCSLIMRYEEYAINAEFESTGIKKLIRLYDYLNKMVQGNIVFIDEFDSNLHDVYLCALLEFLMDNAKGQLCFTTHNIGPMDVLKKNKKSIDFLSTDHKVYPWKHNGNYSPSSLYKNGMIEGSAFNVFSFDFVRAFNIEEDQ